MVDDFIHAFSSFVHVLKMSNNKKVQLISKMFVTQAWGPKFDSLDQKEQQESQGKGEMNGSWKTLSLESDWIASENQSSKWGLLSGVSDIGANWRATW